jgi:hypothetical protein
MTEIFDGVFRYRFFTDEGYAMAREEDLQPATTAAEKPKPKFVVSDQVIYRQGTPSESTFTIKKAEFEDGKWFYVMTAMRGASPYRIAENELVLAPLPEETEEDIAAEIAEAEEEEKEVEKEQAEQIKEAEKSSWKKGMSLTDEQIEQAKEDAIMHVADEDIPRTVMLYYNQQGKDAALRVLKEKIMNWGQGGPDEPDVRGSPKGVEVSNAIMNPTDVKIISYPDLLDYIIRWDQLKAQAYNKPKETPKVPVEKPVTQPTVTTQPTKTTQPTQVKQPAPAAAPRPTKILSSEDMRRLQDYWNTEFFRALGKVPANISSVFRVEFEAVKLLSFEEAKEKIIVAADEIIEEFKAREVTKRAVPLRPIGAPSPAPRGPFRVPIKEEISGEEPENGGAGGSVPFGRVPPSQFPSFPLCYDLPFPRGPCSSEQLKLWDVFLYQMQQAGYFGGDYQRQFDDYISGTQFLSWEDLKAKFDLFVKTIMSGLDLPPLFTWRGVPIPTGLKGIIQEREPLEKIEDLVVHYSSVVIRNARARGDIATLEDLKDELVTHMVIPQETSMAELTDAAKTALTRAIERKDLWVSGISTAEINDFLASG